MGFGRGLGAGGGQVGHGDARLGGVGGAGGRGREGDAGGTEMEEVEGLDEVQAGASAAEVRLGGLVGGRGGGGVERGGQCPGRAAAGRALGADGERFVFEHPDDVVLRDDAS